MPEETVSELIPHLYSPDGATFIKELTGRVASSYQDRNSDVGSGTLVMRESDPDAADLTPMSVIKYHLLDGIRFGARIGIETATYDETDCTITWSCMGLLGAFLGDAVVLDENGGIRAKSTGQRWIGWMSAGYDDTVDGWITDISSTSFVWTDTVQQSAFRLGYPTDWPDPEAWWLHRGDFGGQFQLWRRSFTTGSDEVLKLWASADEEITVYFDGEKVLELSGESAPDETGYTASNPTELGIVAAGTHHLAVEWRGKITPITGDDFDGFIVTVGTVDADGNYLANVTRTDDSGNWRSYGGVWEDPRPGMSRLAAMKMLYDEAAARGCFGPSNATLGFTADLDSTGQPHDSFVNVAINLADQTLDQVFLMLAENHVDLWFDADTMTLEGWNRRGSDLSGSVALKRGVPGTVELVDGANVTEVSTTRELRVVTDLYGQLADGSYTEAHSDTARTAWGGRIERGASFGNVPVGDGAVELATVLSGLTDPTDTLTLGQALHGAIPYVDYNIGDDVTAPAHRTGTVRARCTSITADQREGQDYADVYPGLVPNPE